MTGSARRDDVLDFAIGDDPDESYISDLRQRFPTEPEIDATLTRKLRRRGSGPYHRPTLADMEAHLTAFLDHELGAGEYAVGDLQWFTGGVSKIQVGLTLRWSDRAGTPRRDRMVLRMDPSEGSNATSRAREFELLGLVRDVVPVPETFFIDPDGQWFPEPALIYAFSPGVTKPARATTGSISGLGTDFGPRLRARLAPQFIEHLAAIHTLPVAGRTFAALQAPRVGTDQAARWAVNHVLRTWEEDRLEDVALVEVAINWLLRHVPVLDVVSVVHGDYRSGNFLFDEDSGEIVSWLDWERGLLGDRHRDLAWTAGPTMGHYDEHGVYLVCGLIPIAEFYARYEERSGLTVEPQRLRFFEVLNCVGMIVSTLASAARIVRLGKSHQDIILARVEGMVPVISRRLATLLSGER